MVKRQVNVRLDADLVDAAHEYATRTTLTFTTLVELGLRQVLTGDTQAVTEQAQGAGKPPRGARAPEPRTCEHRRDQETVKAWGVICDPVKGGCGVKLR